MNATKTFQAVVLSFVQCHQYADLFITDIFFLVFSFLFFFSFISARLILLFAPSFHSLNFYAAIYNSIFETFCRLNQYLKKKKNVNSIFSFFSGGFTFKVSTFNSFQVLYSECIY